MDAYRRRDGIQFSFEEAHEASLAYFDGDEIASEKFLSKYALRDGTSYYEKTPEDMHRRLAKEFARIELNYPNPLSEDEIFELFDRFRYVVPQGSPMSGIGNALQVQSLSNCFVIDPPYDSYGGICRTDEEELQIMKRRGGVGFDISTIRPKGMRCANAARTTAGIAGFLERYSNSCREVGQGGRRGALMITISCHHPEVLTFARIKNDLTKVTGANLSIRMSDEFMKAVEDGTAVELRWPVESEDKRVSEKVDARELWDDIVSAAREVSEPGLLFWDTAKRRTPSDCYKDEGFGSVATNPCGEVILSPYDSCRLMAINLLSFVSDPFEEDAAFDFNKLEEVAEKAQRLMDDLIDLEVEAVNKIIAKVKDDPEPVSIKGVELALWKRIRETALRGRRTGLGITALGDVIASLGMTYGDADSIKVTEQIYKHLAIGAYRSSCVMAGERGAFPVFSHTKEEGHEFLDQIWAAAPDVAQLYKRHGRRNIALTTTAPTGTVSIMTQTTNGIEPAIFLKYTRRTKINPDDPNVRVDFVDKTGDKWQEFDVFHHSFRKWMDVTGKKDAKESPYHNATAQQMDWVKKIAVQAAAQKWVCHSISNTTNLPKDVPISVVQDIYMQGWKLGCFPAGAGIYTSAGIVEIQDVQAGNLVYGQDGNLHEVEKKFVLEPEERVLVSIEPYCREPIYVTAEHPIAVMNTKCYSHGTKLLDMAWKKAGDITDNDYVVLPRLEHAPTQIELIHVLDFIDDACVVDGIAYPTRKNPYTNNQSRCPGSNGIKNKILLTDDFIEFLGWFIAEGHYAGSAVRLNFAMHELSVAENLKRIALEVFGQAIQPSIFETNGNGGRSLRLEFGCVIAVRLLEKLVGRGSRNKHLPPFFATLEARKLKILIDAHFRGDAGVTTSRKLARELFLASMLCKMKPKFKTTHNGDCFLVEQAPEKRSWVRVFDNLLVSKIKRVTKSVYDQEVFNLSVKGSDTYIANGTLVHNCKGVTIYREGSRSGVLVKSRFEQHSAPGRKKELRCRIHHATIKGEAWTILVGLMEDKPYELFGGLSTMVEIPRKYKEGIIVKHPRKTTASVYDLVLGDGDDRLKIKDIVKAFDNPTEQGFTRTISLALRTGAPVQTAVEQLQKDHRDSDMFSFSRVMARVLKTYIPNGTKAQLEKVCPECESGQMVYQEGCVLCMGCGYSKCM